MALPFLKGIPAETIQAAPIITMKKAEKELEGIAAAWETCRKAIALHKSRAEREGIDEMVAANEQNLMVGYMVDALGDHAHAVALCSLLLDECLRLEHIHDVRSGKLLDLAKIDKKVDGWLTDKDRKEIEEQAKDGE